MNRPFFRLPLALLVSISALAACSSSKNESDALNGTLAPTTTTVGTQTTATATPPKPDSLAAVRVDTVLADLAASKRTGEADALRAATDPCAQLSVLARLTGKDAASGAAGQVAAAARSAQAALLLTAPTAQCGGLQTPASGQLGFTSITDTTESFGFEVSFPPATFALDSAALTSPAQAYAFAPGAPLRLFVDGAGGTGKVGEPQRADWSTVVAVPTGSKPSATITETGSVKLGDVLVAASQVSAADGEPTGDSSDPLYADRPISVNRDAYSAAPGSNAPVVTLASVGRFRGVELYRVTVPSVRYNPASRELTLIAGARVSVSFGRNTGKFADSTGAASQWDRATLALDKFVANKGAVSKWFAGSMLSPAITSICGPELLIVTPSAFKADATRLATAKASAGIITKVYEMPAGTTAMQLFDTIKKAATDPCFIKLSYVILLGDVEYIPTLSYNSTWVKNAYTDGTDGLFGTDFPYTQIDGDLFPDIFLGRLPAASTAEATAMVDKTIAYQKTPTTDPAFYKNATVSGYFQYPRDAAKNVTSYTQDGRGFSRTANLITDKLSTTYAVDRLLVAESSSADPKKYDDGTAIAAAQQKPTTPWTSTGSQFVADLNAGRFFALHRDHGGVQSVGNPSMSSTDMLNLTNKDKQGLVITVDCLAGTYEAAGKTGFDEAMLKNAKGGAVAAIGAAEVSPSSNNNDLARGFVDAWYPSVDPASSFTGSRFGEILLAGKSYVYAQAGSNATSESALTEWYLYNLLGDPSLTFYKKQPSSTKIMLAVKNGIIGVSTAAGALPAGSFVTVYKGTTPVGRSLGSALPVLPKGTYLVSVEIPGDAPQMSSIDVP